MACSRVNFTFAFSVDMLDLLIAMYAACVVTRVMELTETHATYTVITVNKSDMSTASHCNTPTWDYEKYDYCYI
jgi:hypothetical protein